MRQNAVSRRGFNAGTAAVAFGAMVVPRRVLGGAGYLPPSETVNFALVGCGGQGASDATEMVDGGANLVALADVGFGFGDSIYGFFISPPYNADGLIAKVAMELGNHFYF